MLGATYKNIDLSSFVVHPIKCIDDNNLHRQNYSLIEELNLKTQFLNDLKVIVSSTSNRYFIYNRNAELVELSICDVFFNVVA